MKHLYRTGGGVCSSVISFDLENGLVRHICFEGGCDGNTQGVSILADGMKATELIKKLRNIKCGFKDSSCPDQLAIAVEKAMAEENSRPNERK